MKPRADMCNLYGFYSLLSANHGYTAEQILANLYRLTTSFGTNSVQTIGSQCMLRYACRKMSYELCICACTGDMFFGLLPSAMFSVSDIGHWWRQEKNLAIIVPVKSIVRSPLLPKQGKACIGF